MNAIIVILIFCLIVTIVTNFAISYVRTIKLTAKKQQQQQALENMKSHFTETTP